MECVRLIKYKQHVGRHDSYELNADNSLSVVEALKIEGDSSFVRRLCMDPHVSVFPPRRAEQPAYPVCFRDMERKVLFPFLCLLWLLASRCFAPSLTDHFKLQDSTHSFLLRYGTVYSYLLLNTVPIINFYLGLRSSDSI
jgi:hypothetical protein